MSTRIKSPLQRLRMLRPPTFRRLPLLVLLVCVVALTLFTAGHADSFSLSSLGLRTPAQRAAMQQALEAARLNVTNAIKQYTQKGSSPTDKLRLEHEDVAALPPDEVAIDGVANSTLNFGKIYHINLPSRHDREDAIVLQSAVSGIRTELVPGVTDLDPKGLPPDSRNGERLTPGAIGCFRSHANVWRKMIQDDIQSAMVIEADACWDVNIRHMTYHLAHGLESIMRQQGFLLPEEGATPEDPLLSSHWDFLQLGGCFPLRRRANLNIQYYDPYAPNFLKYYGEPVKPNHRVIRYRGEEVCTVAYAVSRRGALKLLLRTAVDMEQPVDLVIKEMIDNGQLQSYTVWPVFVNQWVYKKSLGIGYKDSEIRGPTGPSNNTSVSKTMWQTLHNTLNVWGYRFPSDSRFTNGVLENLKGFIFDNAPAGGPTTPPTEEELAEAKRKDEERKKKEEAQHKEAKAQAEIQAKASKVEAEAMALATASAKKDEKEQSEKKEEPEKKDDKKDEPKKKDEKDQTENKDENKDTKKDDKPANAEQQGEQQPPTEKSQQDPPQQKDKS